jgi:isoleucyl-tRNA synthetase
MFSQVPTQVDFTAQEHRILEHWKQIQAFETRRKLNEGQATWSFLDGPITANNPMGVHHAWGRTYKDVFNRYWAMKGYDTRYQNGFDCQGLWVEVEVEKELGYESKRDIERHGLEDFVNLCKQRVLRYAAVQTEQSIRLGYWMDWNDPALLQELEAKMARDASEVITVEGPYGPVTDRVEQIVGRLGMPELGGSYFTFSNENNYMIWSMLKTCHDRGWVYRGHDVMPWCARCGTGISQHEIVTEGYVELTHPSIYLYFPLRNRPGESLLVWTTTPWTLTSNMAVAVHPDLPYVLVGQADGNREGHRFWVSKGALPNAVRGDYQVQDEKLGRELVGWKYNGPFDELPVIADALQRVKPYPHRVIPWDEVSEAEGTGLVHIAPGCGAEDFQLGLEYDLPAVAPLDELGVYVDGFDWLTGMNVRDVRDPIFQNLREKGLVHRIEDYEHRYPICWRCGEELVFRLVDEWFIRMGDQLDKPLEQVTEEEKEQNLRYQIMDIVQNETQWYPSFGLEREMDWLRNMNDWMISKKRYWGLALPIWECECGHFEVIGSREELRARAVKGWEAFEGHTPHRPWIDAVQIECPECGGLERRIPDVGNPWLDAGIVGLSTVRYRSEPDYWEKWTPADLITESFPGQFRCWFYSLLTMSTVMTRRTPFQHCYTYGLLFAEDGRQMHKSWGNAIWFDDAAEAMGVDVMRWMYCMHKPEQNLLFGYSGADETRRRFLIPFWNVYAFFANYARLDGWEPRQMGIGGTPVADVDGNPRDPAAGDTVVSAQSRVRSAQRGNQNVLDRWILSKLQALIADVTSEMDDYDVYDAANLIEDFVDELSNWYVRRSRRRFWRGAGEADADKDAAYSTLYSVLTMLCRLLAPFVPFVVESIYQNLVKTVEPDAPDSVHHQDWPVIDASLLDKELMADMEIATMVASLGHSARNSANIRLRQPLAKATVVADARQQARLERLSEIVLDELNVKELAFVREADDLVHYEIGLNPRLLGPKHGALFPRLRAAVANMPAATLARTLQADEPFYVTVDGKEVEVLPSEAQVRMRAREGIAVADAGGIVVGIDTELTPELVQEGLAQDIVRRIQDARKNAGFEIEDRIALSYQADEPLRQVLQGRRDYIGSETLALQMEPGPPLEGGYTESFDIGGAELQLSIKRTRGRKSA